MSNYRTEINAYIVDNTSTEYTDNTMTEVDTCWDEQGNVVGYYRHEKERYGEHDTIKISRTDEKGRPIMVETPGEDGYFKTDYYAYGESGDYVVQSRDYKGNLESVKRYDRNGDYIGDASSGYVLVNGKSYAFNANALSSVIVSLQSSSSTITNILDGISSTCSSISTTVSSDDSNLSSVLTKTHDTCVECRSLVDKLIEKVTNDIDEYITKTVANEDTVAVAVDQVNDSLSNINDVFNSINKWSDDV